MKCLNDFCHIGANILKSGFLFVYFILDKADGIAFQVRVNVKSSWLAAVIAAYHSIMLLLLKALHQRMSLKKEKPNADKYVHTGTSSYLV
uniref:Uncharacterized protein n=1 Tax=Oryctolagus cuniculus TaxID=9986 RepID=A0A5F9D443_RABIT